MLKFYKSQWSFKRGYVQDTFRGNYSNNCEKWCFDKNVSRVQNYETVRDY